MRDGGCRFPGCDHERFVEAHHVEHWCDGGDTSIDNTLLLCSAHHAMLHDGVFGITADAGGFVFADAQGRPVPEAGASLVDPRITLARAAAMAATASAETNCPLWDGDPIDYDAAIDALHTLHA